ncbi:hypothetical protein D3C81_1697340 [compost metagenome]
MRTAERYQSAFGLWIAEHGDVGAQGFAKGAAAWMGVRGERGTGGVSGGDELFALIAVAGFGGELAVHIGLLLIL